MTDRKKEDNSAKHFGEMTFLQHLDVLRWHLMRAVIAVLLLSIAAFVFKKVIFDYIILAPKNSDFITNRALCKLATLLDTPNLCIDKVDLPIVNIQFSGQFMTHIMISFFVGFIVAAPYIIWELWRFIKPALRRNEKKASRGAVLFSSLLFVFGILFSYFIVVPLTINFFGTYEVSEAVKNTISLSSYVGTILSVTLGVGVVFEMPIIMLFLSKAGIVTPDFLKRKRRIMVVIIFIISAIITPADILSLFLVAIPLLILYELGIILSKRVYRKKLKAEKQY